MSVDTEIRVLTTRVEELESRPDYLYRHLSLESEEENHVHDGKVIDMLKKGHVIEAIKIYRKLYNVGLAEAKKAVDGLQANLRM
ncbi:MAG TPA: hypothetical protein VGB38_02165 [bacterium]